VGVAVVAAVAGVGRGHAEMIFQAAITGFRIGKRKNRNIVSDQE
jgi:hypothetical protein